jgi:hypothetical protein
VGFTATPAGGATAASAAYSAALLALNGTAAATSWLARALSAATSPMPEASACAGPLTVVRLLRTVLRSVELFDDERLGLLVGREDFAMKDCSLRTEDRLPGWSLVSHVAVEQEHVAYHPRQPHDVCEEKPYNRAHARRFGNACVVVRRRVNRTDVAAPSHPHACRTDTWE